MDQEKKIEKIYPSEIGAWMTCRKKWLFEYMRRKNKLPAAALRSGPRKEDKSE